jgi:hypothetical protein
LVAKAIKISERIDQPGRLRSKDALDILRLLSSVDCEDLVERFVRLLAHEFSRETTRDALVILPEIFGSVDDIGCRLAVTATRGLDDPDTVANSCVALVEELISALEKRKSEF